MSPFKSTKQRKYLFANKPMVNYVLVFAKVQEIKQGVEVVLKVDGKDINVPVVPIMYSQDDIKALKEKSQFAVSLENTFDQAIKVIEGGKVGGGWTKESDLQKI